MMKTLGWRIALGACTAGLYAIAVTNAAYQLTSPSFLPYGVALRKTYAIGAFALLGFLAEKAELPVVRGPGWCAILIGLFSAGIEVGQYDLSGSRESRSEHAFDIACGALGGAVGAWLARAVDAGRAV